MANPFDSPPFEEATKEPVATKPTLAAEAKDLLGTARSLENQAFLAKKTRNWAWLEKIKSLAWRLMGVLWDFTKKALLLSLFNFIVEICNQVLSSATEGLSKHKTAAPQTSNQNYGDPFSRHYNSGLTW